MKNYYTDVWYGINLNKWSEWIYLYLHPTFSIAQILINIKKLLKTLFYLENIPYKPSPNSLFQLAGIYVFTGYIWNKIDLTNVVSLENLSHHINPYSWVKDVFI